MMAELWAWALAYPTLASVLFLIVWLALGLLVTLVFGLSRMPASLMDAAQGDDDGDDEPACHGPRATAIPWRRSGGNWWPNP